MTLLREIERSAEELNFSVLIQNSHGDPEKELRAVTTLRSMNVEGVLIAPIGAPENALAFKKFARDLPLVLVDARCPGHEMDFSFVGTDNQQSMTLMVDYLRRSGSAPKFLTMPAVNSNSSEREEAYTHHMLEVGLKPEIISTTFEVAIWDFELRGYEVVKGLIEKGLESDATILCANDRLAMGAHRAANEAGLFKDSSDNAPRFRVAGHDDHPLSRYMWPPMTTVSQDVSCICRAEVECVSKLARAPQDADIIPTEHLFPAQLCIRNSA